MPSPAVTENAPTWSAMPVSFGATKSDRHLLVTPSRCCPCWRSPCSVVSTVVRASSA